MNEIEKRYNDIENEILKASKSEDIEIIKIPNWDPVNIHEGLRWIRSSVFEGYYVKYRIVKEERRIDVLNWEYGEEEPDFV